MRTFTKDQIEAIKRVLADSNVRVSIMRAKPSAEILDELDKRMAELRAMKFKTAAVKSQLLKTLMNAKEVRDNRSILDHVLAFFGFTVKDVNPWPYIKRGHYGPALANAVKTRLLLTYAPGESDCLVYADAAAPHRIITTTRGRRDFNGPLRSYPSEKPHYTTNF